MVANSANAITWEAEGEISANLKSARAINTNTYSFQGQKSRGSGVQGQPWLHCELEANLGYLKSQSQKQQQKTHQLSELPICYQLVKFPQIYLATSSGQQVLARELQLTRLPDLPKTQAGTGTRLTLAPVYWLQQDPSASPESGETEVCRAVSRYASLEAVSVADFHAQ